MSIGKDSFGHKLQAFVPTENKSGVTSLNVKGEHIVAVMITSPVNVKINNTSPAVSWPVGAYAMSPLIETLDFSTAANIVVMK